MPVLTNDLMKYILPILLFFALLPNADAQKKNKTPISEAKPARNAIVTVDMIAVSRADAFTLVRLDSATMWAKVCEMVKDGTATSEYITTVSAISGERCIVEFLNETRYPTEFDSPLGPKKEEDGKATPSMIVDMMQSQLFPVAFETRNVGATMELIAMIRGDTIELDLIPSRTLLDRFISYPIGSEKNLARADQPQFQTFKVQTKIAAESGKPLFLASGDADPSREGKNRDKILLLFVTVTIQPAK